MNKESSDPPNQVPTLWRSGLPSMQRDHQDTPQQKRSCALKAQRLPFSAAGVRPGRALFELLAASKKSIGESHRLRTEDKSRGDDHH